MNPDDKFSIHRRPTTKKGRYIYYVQFWDGETGGYGTAHSSRQTSRGAAQAWAVQQIKEGKVVVKGNLTFDQWVKKWGWWQWGQCRYLRRRQTEGSPIGRSYANIAGGYLENHILPYFKDKKLSHVKRKDVEAFKMHLKETTSLSEVSINHILTCLGIMLREAFHAEYLPANPAVGVRRLREHSAKKGVLTLAEAKELFKKANLQPMWGGNLQHYVLNYTAALSGCRFGELAGLQIGRIHPPAPPYSAYLHISKAWERKYGLRDTTKTGRERDVPITAKAYGYLTRLIKLSPYREPEDLVFWGADCRMNPVDHKTMADTLYRALKAIGISEEERKARNVSFHSWRHFLNTNLRAAGIPDFKIRLLTGHATERMTEHYTHVGLESLADVCRLQETLL